MPQSLNRYGATSMGAPGVAEGVVQSSLAIPGLLRGFGRTLAAGVIGQGIQSYISDYGYLRIHPGYRKQLDRLYPGLFNRATSPNPGFKPYYSTVPVKPLGNQRFKLFASNQVIDLKELPIIRRRGQTLERYFVSNYGLTGFLRGPAGEFTTGFVVDTTLAIPDLINIWQNPYLNVTQKRVQTAVEGVGIVAGVLVGIQVGKQVSALGGPVPFVVTNVAGFGVLFVWDYGVKPGVTYIATSVFNAQDPFDDSRRLAPLN